MHTYTCINSLFPTSLCQHLFTNMLYNVLLIFEQFSDRQILYVLDEFKKDVLRRALMLYNPSLLIFHPFSSCIIHEQTNPGRINED